MDAESLGIGPNALRHQRASDACPSPSGLAFLEAEDGVIETQAVTPTSLSRRVRYPVRFIFLVRRAEFPPPMPLRTPDAFKAPPKTLFGSLSMAEGRVFETHTHYRCRSLSRRRWYPVQFTFRGVAGGNRTRISYYGILFRRQADTATWSL